MDLITKSLTMNELEKYRIPVLHHIMPIRLLPTMAKNDHDYPATRILANGHTLVIASEGNNRIGMHHITPSKLLYTKILRKFCKIIKSYLYPIVILFLAVGEGHGTGS